MGADMNAELRARFAARRGQAADPPAEADPPAGSPAAPARTGPGDVGGGDAEPRTPPDMNHALRVAAGLDRPRSPLR